AVGVTWDSSFDAAEAFEVRAGGCLHRIGIDGRRDGAEGDVGEEELHGVAIADVECAVLARGEEPAGREGVEERLEEADLATNARPERRRTRLEALEESDADQVRGAGASDLQGCEGELLQGVRDVGEEARVRGLEVVADRSRRGAFGEAERPAVRERACGAADEGAGAA